MARGPVECARRLRRKQREHVQPSQQATPALPWEEPTCGSEARRMKPTPSARLATTMAQGNRCPWQTGFVRQ
eukprot:scaffold649242_cov42-Prasinocladus_malaysianus.AAC.1